MLCIFATGHILGLFGWGLCRLSGLCLLRHSCCTSVLRFFFVTEPRISSMWLLQPLLQSFLEPSVFHTRHSYVVENAAAPKIVISSYFVTFCLLPFVSHTNQGGFSITFNSTDLHVLVNQQGTKENLHR